MGKLREKDVQLQIKEFELEKFRNPPQTSIRGVFSELIPGFGRKEESKEDFINSVEESDNDNAERTIIEEDPILMNEAESSIDLKEGTIKDTERDQEESIRQQGM